MKTFKKIVVVAMSLCFALGTIACGNNSGNDVKQKNTSLTITVQDEGYGTDWLKNMLNRFGQQKGIDVKVIPNVTVGSTMAGDLEESIIDMYISHQISWDYYASQGKLEPLTDLYETEVSSDGTTFKDRIIDSAVDSSWSGGYYFKVPWTQGAGGIVYNVKMLKQVGWNSPPSTYAELQELCDDIIVANIPINDEKGNVIGKVTPFIYPGLAEWMWDYIFYEWWAQLAGPNTIQEFLKYESVDVFNPEVGLPEVGFKEFKEAFKYWYDLFAVNAETYMSPGCDVISKDEATDRFISGWAVMMPNAHWMTNEIAQKVDQDWEMAMFTAPTLPNALDGYEKVNFSVGFGDSIVVSRKSQNKKLAKEFLIFMSEEDNCIAFSNDVPGTNLAFKYDVTAAAKNHTYAQSIAKILTEEISFNIFSNSTLSRTLGTEVINPWPFNQQYYKESCQYNDGTISDIYTVDKIIDVYVWDEVQIVWQNWQNSIS